MSAPHIPPGGSAIESVRIHGIEFRRGDVVRLRPRRGADILDAVLAGKRAIIESIQEDSDGRVLLAIVLEDDPERDLAFQRQPGHRFFFEPDEVQPLRC